MKIAFVASPTARAREAETALRERYGDTQPKAADVIVALGGDGGMLRALRKFMKLNKPIYGMNLGSTGFLMNAYAKGKLPERIESAQETILHPLKMTAKKTDGTTQTALAINEVSLLRQSPQTARLRISVDGKLRMKDLACDGVLVATAAGSTAYNLSVHGPIIPLGARLLALTPISAFRPRHWRGALLPASAKTKIENSDPKKRPVSVVADHTDFRNITEVHIEEDTATSLRLLFDKEHALEERIVREQFAL